MTADDRMVIVYPRYGSLYWFSKEASRYFFCMLHIDQEGTELPVLD